jgi:hypothetical protein
MAQGIVICPFDFGAYSAPSRCILNGITDGTLNPSWAVTAGDQLQVVLYPRNKSSVTGALTTTQRLAAGSSIVVVGKLTTALDATSLLFKAINFVETNSAGVGQTTGDWLYTGYLDLDTDELAAAIPTGAVSVPVMLIIDVIDPTGNPQRFLANITVFNECYSGTEGNPAPATPAFLTAAQTQAEFLNNWNFITDIAGGTATSLNAQPTAGVVAFGTQVALRGIEAVNGGGYTIWEYTNTSATGGAYVQPTDYDPVTNPGAWLKLL